MQHLFPGSLKYNIKLPETQCTYIGNTNSDHNNIHNTTNNHINKDNTSDQTNIDNTTSDHRTTSNQNHKDNTNRDHTNMDNNRHIKMDKLGFRCAKLKLDLGSFWSRLKDNSIS